jgi:hypothetical protein
MSRFDGGPVIPVILALFFAAAAFGQNGQDAVKQSTEQKTPCLLVKPTIGFQTAFGRLGGRYEYMDSFNVPNPKMKYSKGDLEKLLAKHVHVVVVSRDAERNEVKQARESCGIASEPEKK